MSEKLKTIREELINNSEYLALKKELEDMKAEEQREAYDLIQDLIIALELDADKICKKAKKAKGNVSNVPPKYRNVVTGKTWTGRGRQPKDFDSGDWVEI